MLKCASYLALALALAGCGTYRPLYGVSPGQTGVAEDISSIAVQAQKSRSGQLVRNEILDGATTVRNRYSLILDVTETFTEVSHFSSSSAARQRLHLQAHFELRGAQSGKVIIAADSFSNVEFDLVKVPVADLQAKENASARAAKLVGQDIKLRLAASLSAFKG